MSAIAWCEFLKGPLSPARLSLVTKVLSPAPVRLTDAEANEAARWFNAVGRSRRFNVEAMIAASVITAGAELATANPANFKLFVQQGLKLFVVVKLRASPAAARSFHKPWDLRAQP